ncbi:M23 family metallopeptidase [Vibrio sp. 10N.261.51.F12]|uniref:M23 family metallopeptidase n=1 Tax=Vibrio sp. 10N.261.51.F12 TaxID=3229679 RepID=UPI00354DE888
MKDQLTISISTINGSAHWQLSKRIRRAFKSLVAIGGLTSVGVLGLVIYLSSSVDDAQLKHTELISESQNMANELIELQDLKLTLEQDLVEQEETITLVSERLTDLEHVLGVTNDSRAEPLDVRLDMAAIHSNVRMTMLTQIPSGSPVGQERISSQFGKRVHPVSKKAKMHRGLDFAVNTGTKIFAPADGVVEVTRKSSKGSGNFLRLQHAYGFSSSYSHLSRFNVKNGQFVQKGELIAISGNSGLSSGPHLHYEVRFVGRALNPKPFVDWGVNDFEDIFKKERGIRWESLVKTVEQRVAQQLQLSSPKGVLLAENSN